MCGGVAGKRTSWARPGGEREREVREGEVADRWGLRASESELANGRSALTGRTHHAVREKGQERERIDTDRLGPPGSGMERASGRRNWH
jgi:hypothetical protein